ncbi:MAG TPA: cache domain-containing protein [Telmatospirillum sp.]|nr:cache domain-containing protein [Telmatospirillum sp.]
MTACLLAVAAIVAGWEGASQWKIHNDGVDAWALEVHHAAFEIADMLGESVHAIEEEMSIHDVPAAEAMLPRQSPPEATLASFNNALAAHQQIAFIALFNASGDLLASTDANLKRQRVTARGRDFLAYFINGGKGSHVTASYLLGPAIERTPIMRILITQGLKDPNGAFGGVLVTAMTPDSVLRTLIDPTLYLGKDVRLFLDNGRLLATHRDGGDAIGENFASHRLFRETAGGALPKWGVLPDPFEDKPEIAALHKTDGLPFLISVMTTNGPDLGGWWYRVAFLLGYAGLSVIGGVFFLMKGLWLHGDSADIASDDAPTAGE